MTKLIHVRLTVATDDGVTTDDFVDHLERKMSAMETERFGEDGLRVHWPTAAVTRIVERPQANGAKPTPPAPARKRASTAAQPPADAERPELPV
jgi:hypothetical protein